MIIIVVVKRLLFHEKTEQSQSANPAMFDLKNKRIFVFQEVEKTGDDHDVNSTINIERLKLMTGRDCKGISCRPLYGKQETFPPTFLPIVCANKQPSVNTDDGGTDRRVRNIPFESKFVENLDDEKWENLENVYQIDTSLKDKLKNWECQ